MGSRSQLIEAAQLLVRASSLIRDALDNGYEPTPYDEQAAAEGPDLADLVYRMRRARNQAFPDLFAEPSWDILLDLHNRRGRGENVSVSAACIASDVPPTTALRHINGLIEAGLVTREPHPGDARVVYLQLTPAATDAFTRWELKIKAMRPTKP